MNETTDAVKTMIFKAVDCGLIASYDVYDLALQHGGDFYALAVDLIERAHIGRHTVEDNGLVSACELVMYG